MTFKKIYMHNIVERREYYLFLHLPVGYSIILDIFVFQELVFKFLKGVFSPHARGIYIGVFGTQLTLIP